MRGLTPGDFEIRDNGQLRQVLSLGSDLQSPISLAIVVDMSGSMRVGSKKAMARQAFDSILSQLRDGQDEVALLTFDSGLHERQDFTQDLGKLRGALSDFEAFGTTSLYDATAATARRVAARSASHRAIIVLTDGIDTSSALNAAEVSGLASSIDVPVYMRRDRSLSIDQRAMMEGADRLPQSGSADLRDLAEWTGGRFVSRHLHRDGRCRLDPRDGFRRRVPLAIEAAGEREWRRLDIRVKHPAATVKARSGYFGG